MSYSLNEVAATARKAVRGAGYAWGLADEAGKAVRWLCANGVDGCAALAGFLPLTDGRDLKDLNPDVSTDDWTAQGPFVCPITAGAGFAVLARETVRIDAVAAPLLMAPFLANAARSQGQLLQMNGDGWHLATDGQGLCLEDVMPSQSKVVVQSCAELGTPMAQVTRATPHPQDWDILNSFAHRTYAPATEESRLKGAG